MTTRIETTRHQCAGSWVGLRLLCARAHNRRIQTSSRRPNVMLHSLSLDSLSLQTLLHNSILLAVGDTVRTQEQDQVLGTRSVVYRVLWGVPG